MEEALAAAVEEARQKFEAESGPRRKAVEASEFLNQRAMMLVKEGRAAAAQPLLREILHTRRAKLSEADGRLGDALLALAQNCLRLLLWDEGEALLIECEGFVKTAKADHARRARVLLPLED